MNLMFPGQGYSRYVPFVGTTVFHWFKPCEGNLRGPWPPPGGRPLWTGEPDFWMGQIKQMMMANIDAAYLHCINTFEEQRINYFRAGKELRKKGWEVPKIAPFLDPFMLWAAKPIDVATEEGKDEFVSHYIRFFKQYLSVNDDPLAETFLLHIDGKVVLSTWWVFWLLQNLDKLSRTDVERRLMAALGDRIPSLSNGIYMMTTALIDPDLSFSDERMVMFSGYTPAIHSVHNGLDVWHVQAGYWDQNIRRPGYFMPRDGGKHYESAWQAVVAALPNVHRVYVESWNEYDEASGIYAASPDSPFLEEGMRVPNTDGFSRDGDPFEYIDTTAHGAALINRRPENDALVLAVDAPPQASAGSTIQIDVVVRNQGNARWSGSAGYGLRTSQGITIPIDDEANDIPLYRGVFRGRTVALSFNTEVPDDVGPWSVTFQMVQDGLPFGPECQATIHIVSDSVTQQSHEDRVSYKSLLTTPYDAAERALLAVASEGRKADIVATTPRLVQPDREGQQLTASELTGLQTKIKQQAIAIERLNGALAEKEAALSAMYKSKSWRITRLLRSIAACGRK